MHVKHNATTVDFAQIPFFNQSFGRVKTANSIEYDVLPIFSKGRWWVKEGLKPRESASSKILPQEDSSIFTQ